MLAELKVKELYIVIKLRKDRVLYEGLCLVLNLLLAL
jgi:hypothetical protein